MILLVPAGASPGSKMWGDMHGECTECEPKMGVGGRSPGADSSWSGGQSP